jgi:hypothetical protein
VLHVDAHLARDDVRERGLAQSRGPEEQRVVEGFLAVARAVMKISSCSRIFAARRIPRAGAGEARVPRLLDRRGLAPRDQPVGFDHVFSHVFANSFKAWRMASVSGRSAGSCFTAARLRGHCSPGIAAH